MKNIKTTQHGAALVTALVLLTILTILAVSAMTTNTLEERMAANYQEAIRAFQAGDSGVALAEDNDGVYNASNTRDDNGTPFNFDDDSFVFDTNWQNVLDNDYTAEVRYWAVSRGARAPGRSSASARQWGTGTAVYDFDVTVVARSPGGVERTYETGFFQVGVK